MIDIDRWNEVYATLSHNKLRTALTAFGVSWGILMLLIMLGAGKGLEKGAKAEFSGSAANSIFLWSRNTSLAYDGYKEGRPIMLTNRDTESMINNLDNLDLMSPGLQLGGWRGANNVSRGDKIGAFEVNGFYPAAKDVKLLKLPQGRFINDKDMNELRKVCVIGQIVRDQLFEPWENPIGEFIKVQGVYFKVVGQFKSSRPPAESENEDRSIYIPFSTFQSAFNQGDRVHWYAFTSTKGHSASVLEQQARELLRKRHHIHPKDHRAIGGWNLQEEMEQFDNIFLGINTLSWFVGVLTLFAGVIGISNIMLIIVKERTKEFGVRRAIGATPLSVVSQVMLESVTLTFLAGAIGFIVGLFAVENLGSLIQHQYFKAPEVPFYTSVAALIVLAFGGALAGVLPSIRAVQVKPVEALRAE